MSPVVRHSRPIPRRIVCAAALLALAACGGGSEEEDADASAPKAASADVSPTELADASAWVEDEAAPWDGVAGAAGSEPLDAARAPLAATAARSGPATAPGVTNAQRAAAAASTAQSAANACAQARPFHWEIGSREGRLAGGAVGSGAVKPTTAISVASASKWLYGAYVAQLRDGAPTASDRRFLSMTSGYGSLLNCSGMASIDACLASGQQGAYTAGWDGVFRYNGGHMQQHASLLGLGALSTKALASEMRARLGSDVPLAFSQPLPAGGAVMSPDAYAVFLRKVLGGQLKIGALLGSGAVCTNSATCAGASFSPSPAGEVLHYTLGHWVEDDPAVGDGAFSSPGAFGFYPWIDRTKTHYGLVARVVEGGGPGSMACGRLIRAAWTSGAAR